jgi:WD40 repeat protein
MQMRPAAEGFQGIAVSSNGKLLAARSHTTIQLWDLSNSKELGVLTRKRKKGFWLASFAISPDGKTLVAGVGSAVEGSTGGEVEVWDVVNRELRLTFGNFTRDVGVVSGQASERRSFGSHQARR